MTYYERRQWGAAANRGRRRLDPDQVEGIALHWPGDKIKRHNIFDVGFALRTWQQSHFAKDWSDIAYQEAIDQDGNVYRLRGLRFRSAANGDEDVNDRFGALLLVLAIGEKPSDAMIRAVRRRVKRHQDLFPRSRRIEPHSAVRPAGTDCPGDHVRRLIKEGAFRP